MCSRISWICVLQSVSSSMGPRGSGGLSVLCQLGKRRRHNSFTPAKELSPSAREEFECRPVTEQLKDWPSSQQRDEYDMLKQVMPIAYDPNKLDLRTNSCCLPVWLFIQPSLVSVF